MNPGEMILYTGVASHEEYPLQPITYKQLLINSKVEIPCPKPDLEYILKVMSEIEVRSYRHVQTPYDFEIIIEGIIHQIFLYSADVPEQSVHTFHACIPFCEFLILPPECKKAYIKKKIVPKVLLEDIFIFNQSSRFIEEYTLLGILLEMDS